MKSRVFCAPRKDGWHRAARVGGNQTVIEAYLWGYHAAGEALVDRALEHGLRDELVYPICFNYRHYLELSIKYLIGEVERLAEKMVTIGELEGSALPSVPEGELLRGHSLERLLRWFEERLALVSTEPVPSSVRKIILEFHNMDPDGQTFRYPIDTDGRPAITKRADYDLEGLRRGMAEVHHCLNGVDGWLGYAEQSVDDYIWTLEQAGPAPEDLDPGDY